MKSTIVTRTLILAICMTLVMLIAMPSFALASGFAAGSTVYVNVEDYLHLRAEPQGEIIGKVARGETVTILSGPDRNSYYHVKVNSTGKVAYVYGPYLTSKYVEKNVRTVAKKKVDPKVIECPYCDVCLEYCDEHVYYVTSKRWLNLRKGPGMDTKVIARLQHGVIVIVEDDEPINKFVKVTVLDSGMEGYVHMDYISQDAPTDVTYVYTVCEEHQGFESYPNP